MQHVSWERRQRPFHLSSERARTNANPVLSVGNSVLEKLLYLERLNHL